jgi:hypothetical protein
VRKLWRSVAEKLQSHRVDLRMRAEWDHRSIVSAECRAHHLRPLCVPLMALPSSLVNSTNGTMLALIASCSP